LPMRISATCGGPRVWSNWPIFSPSALAPPCLKPVAAARCSKPPIVFFANDDIAPDDMLQSHIEATYGRLNAAPIVLAVQDTHEANWTNLRVTEGLGPLGHPACHGLLVHTTLAITPERVPLGLLAQQVWARDPDDIGKRARRGIHFRRDTLLPQLLTA